MIAVYKNEGKSIPFAGKGHSVQGREIPGLRCLSFFHISLLKLAKPSFYHFYQNKALISILFKLFKPIRVGCNVD